MDSNTTYDGYTMDEKKSKIVKQSFYTEMIKDKEPDTVYEKIKTMFVKWLS